MRSLFVSPVLLVVAGLEACGGEASKGSEDSVDFTGMDSGGGAAILVDPTSLDFGEVELGDEGLQSFAIFNHGDENLVASLVIDVGAESYWVDDPATEITPGGQATIRVTFAPQAGGVALGAVRVDSNDPDAPTTTVSLEGTGVGSLPVDNDGDGWLSDDDCDDDDPSVHPLAEEDCNGVDDDCDGEVDEDALDGTTWYRDADGDGYGDPASTVQACEQPEGYVADATDCDDTNGTVYPGAVDVCDGVDNNCDGIVDNIVWYADTDGDGYGDDGLTSTECEAPEGYIGTGGDCDDADAAVNPGATEVCDGIDNDCDGITDPATSADAGTWYADADGDSYGDGSTSVVNCAAPAGYVSDGSDCDDLDPAVNPGAAEVCDGVDNDCDGLVDPGTSADASTWYLDSDADGYGNAALSTDACDAPPGYVADATDCDDGEFAVNPGAAEVCDGIDNNCDGIIDTDAVDALAWYADADGDGYGDAGDAVMDCSAPAGYVADGSDCDDTDGAVNPSATEVCDGIDNDCDGVIDPDTSADATTWYTDADRDGYGDPATATTACSAPAGSVANADDCDDGNASVNPAAVELCDEIDNDCDGVIDPSTSADASTWYLDSDGDGFGDASVSTTSCLVPTAYVLDATDCDDTEFTVNPEAVEVCDGLDNDCDGVVDPDTATDAATWYADSDGDGHGDASVTTVSCSAPVGYLSDGTDCDDTDAAVNPAAAEVCDGIDNDCDGRIDLGAVDGTTWYADSDGDSYGDSTVSMDSCDQPAGYVSDAQDCDDADAAVNPAATEVCDGIDNDCDGVVDPDSSADADTWYLDGDGDGYGDPANTTTACSQPDAYVSDNTDCDDTDGSVNPGATEVCNGIDDDCDGLIDPSTSADATTWYADADSDGYGDAGTSAAACSQPTGYVADATDCDDTRYSVHPGGTETCNSRDDDCDGTVDEGVGSTWYADSDGDGYGAGTGTSSCSAPAGYVSTDTDCDDTDSSVHPGATEVCNGVDDDCDGTIDEGVGSTTYYADADGDGYGDPSSTTTACSAPSGYVTDNTDCDDSDATTHPGASEMAYDRADNDCNGYQDDMSAIDEALYTVLGTYSSDAIGNGGLHITDDLDGDGDPELVVAAGSADIYYGYYTNLGITAFFDVDTLGTDVGLSDAWYRYIGSSSGDYTGCAFTVLDDLDGDGATEMAIGSYQNDANENSDGEVYIIDVYGESGYDWAYYWGSYYADGAIYGDHDDGYYGYSLASGDFDGDGVADLAAGAPGEQSGKGRVYVTFEDNDLGTTQIDNTDSTFYMNGVSSNDHLGYSVVFGDLNDDGYDDLVACAPDDDDNGSSSGTCWMVVGAGTRDTTSVHGTSVSSLYTAKVTGSAASDALGYTRNSLSVGDLDDDGKVDLAIGVPGYDGAETNGGGIWVFRGGSTSGSETVATADWVIEGDGALGYGVNMTGDVTGDGVVDLLGGATTAGAGGEGVVYLFAGDQPTGTYTLPDDQYASWVGENASDYFGYAISGLGDLDGDGRQEFAVAATGNDDGASDAGKVYVLPAYP